MIYRIRIFKHRFSDDEWRGALFRSDGSGPRAHPLGRTTVSIFIHELDDTQEQVFRYYGEDRDYFDVRGEFMTIKYRMRDVEAYLVPN